jgi:hypothetical protein
MSYDPCDRPNRQPDQDFLTKLNDPRLWPKWLRVTYLLTLPVSVPLHWLTMATIAVAMLALFSVAVMVAYVTEIWNGNETP